jgi:adenylate kinase
VSELNIIMLGPPGAGKGTQGRRLEDDFRLPYIATGDMLREAVREGTELGKQANGYMSRGDLVPDEVIIGVIVERIQEEDCRDGFILDGFPRTIPQAEALDSEFAELGRELTAVLLIEVSEEELLKRIAGRRSCVKAGHVYNIHYDRPKREGICDQDGSRLEQREDDQEDKVRHRLQVYEEQTRPLIDYYEERGVLRRFEGSRPPTEVHDHIRATLATLRLEEKL